MHKVRRRVLLVSHQTDLKPKLQADPVPKLAKGFIRLGHDARQISYSSTLAQLSPFKSRSLSHRFYKSKTDQALCEYVKLYKPDFVFIGFSRGLDQDTVRVLRSVAPNAIFFGWDGDLWPSANVGRVEAARELDILFATNNGIFLDEFRKAGAKNCLFMPNLIDTDIDRRYEVDKQWHSDILWTGKAHYQAAIDAGEVSRQQVLDKIAKHKGTKIYGCLNYPKIAGLDYFNAISGARIGISINAMNTIPFYHSDRFTHYSAAGTMVLAKRVPETERLMKDKEHVCYFDTAEECVELADWYLAHEDARKKIADTGMAYCHANYNAEKIVGYMLDAIETGQYEAPWGRFIAS